MLHKPLQGSLQQKVYSPEELMDVEPVQLMLVVHKRLVEMEKRMNYFRDVLSNQEIQLEQNKISIIELKNKLKEKEATEE